MRRLVATALVVGTLLSGTASAATSPMTTSATQDAGDGESELPPDAGRIIGSPEAGPDPQHSGDRGGWAQLLTFGALVVGVGFIMWRIVSAARQASPPSPGEP